MSNIVISDPLSAIIGQPFSILSDGAVLAVAANTLTTIDTFTATGNDRIYLILASGQGFGKFTVEFNSTIILTLRTGPDRNAYFPLNLGLTSGDIVDIKVEHFSMGKTIDYEASFIGFT